MNILMHFRTRGTGAEAVHLAGMANGFVRCGHKVVFSSPTGVDPRRTAGVNPWSTNPGKLPRILFEGMEIAYNAAALLRNGSMLRAGRFGMIYERHAFFLCTTPLLARRHGIPLVVEVNELVGDARIREQPRLKPLVLLSDRILFRRAELVVTVSPYLRRRVIACGGREDRVIVLPNAVPEAVAAHPADGRAVRERLGLGRSTVIGFIGWIAHWHRLDLLVEAFARLDPAANDLRLLLVAEGDRAPLEALAAELGVLDRVRIAGAVPHEEVPAHIAACDVCVVPNSNDYRSPLKMFEYMAQGRPVVAPNVEPVASVLADGENGLLFEPLSAGSMAAALGRLTASPDLRRRVGENARQTVLARHTWEKNAAAVLAAIGAR
jgi:glycosyltransferase involved in cell wall biosynthesis